MSTSAHTRIEIQSRSGINWRCVTHLIDNTYVHIYFKEGDELNTTNSESENRLLNESRIQNHGSGITTRFDRARYGINDRNKDHIHVFMKNRELFALNRDGTGHDNSHGITISNRIADIIGTTYPDFTIPPNNYIESAILNYPLESDEIIYLIELNEND